MRVSACPLREEGRRAREGGGDAREGPRRPGDATGEGRTTSIARAPTSASPDRWAGGAIDGTAEGRPHRGMADRRRDRWCRAPSRKAPPRRCPAVPARATVRPRARVDTGGEPCTSPKAWRSRAAFSRRARPRAVSVETRPAGVGRHRVAREKKRVRDHPRRSGNRRGAKREGRTRAYRGWTGRQP